MKAWPISVFLVTLAAAPINAAIVQSDESDALSRCVIAPAHAIVDGSGAGAVFPQDLNQCQTIDGETVRDPQSEAPRQVPASAPTHRDGSVAHVTLRSIR